MIHLELLISADLFDHEFRRRSELIKHEEAISKVCAKAATGVPKNGEEPKTRDIELQNVRSKENLMRLSAEGSQGALINSVFSIKN